MKLLLCGLMAFVAMAALAADELRIGIIGCDTSHAIAFTDQINNPQAKRHVTGGKVVAGFKGGSPDIPSSASRVEGYTKTLQEKYSVKVYDSIPELCKNVDVVLLESVDGRPHLEQAKPVIAARKPLFIDKPMAGSLKDVIEIFRLAKEANVPVFSSSSLRFATNTQAVRNGATGKVLHVETSSPSELEPHHPDLFWYGVHGVEALYTMMGTGCETVQRGTNSTGGIEVTGTWPGGRKGIFRESKTYGGSARGETGELKAGNFEGYQWLVEEIMKFFKTGIAPVPAAETIELFAFMEAADESKRAGFAPVKLADVLKKHQASK